MMNRKRFGIDIDGTITRPDSILPFLNKDFGLQLTMNDITEYDLTPFVKVEPPILAEWFTKNEALIYEQSPLYEGAKDAVNKWAAIGELYFISARHTYLLDITEAWFHKHQVPYNHIELIGTHDKITTVKKHKIEIFFEDKHDNAVAISEECNIPVLLFNTAYNQGSIPDNVIRVNNWNEAEQWVNNWLKI